MKTTSSAVVIAGALAGLHGVARAEDRVGGVDDHVCCLIGDDRSWCEADDTDVVGYRRCANYGAWGNNLRDPYVFVDVGMTVRHFGFRGGAPLSARTTTPSPTPEGGIADTAYMFNERIGFLLTPGFYIAADFELGDVAPRDTASPNGHTVVVDGLASLGLRGGLGPFVLRGEIAGGVMAGSSTSRDLPTEGMLEARGRVDFWLSPWFTVGGAIGSSLVHEGDWMTGVYLGFHTWAFGGDRW